MSWLEIYGRFCKCACTVPHTWRIVQLARATCQGHLWSSVQVPVSQAAQVMSSRA